MFANDVLLYTNRELEEGGYGDKFEGSKESNGNEGTIHWGKTKVIN